MNRVNYITTLTSWLFCATLGTAMAQGVPQIGERTELAGVTIYISETNRRALQQEVEKLYINRALVAAKVEQMGMYFPLIEPALAQEGIPDDLKFLVLEDSTMAPNQRSTGFWNIGRSNPLGLRVTPTVDERLHLLTATEAAVVHLKALHRQTGNWLVALRLFGTPVAPTAPTPDRKYDEDEKSSYALTEVHDELVMRLLAHKLVLERAFPSYRPLRPLVLFSYTGGLKDKNLYQLADFFRVNQQDVIRVNPWLKNPALLPDRHYPVLIPAPLDQFTEVKRRAGITEGVATSWQDLGFPVLRRLNDARSSDEPVFYTINGKKGIQAQLYDNEITLAYRGRVSVDDFRKFNDLGESQPVYSGEIYYLERKEKRAKVPYHVVKKGQSLWDVAQQYGVLLSFLQRYNDIKPEQRVTPGRILWMQRTRPENTPVEYYRQPETPRSVPTFSDTAGVLASAPKPDGPAAGKNQPDSSGLPVGDRVVSVLPEKQSSEGMMLLSGNATKTVKPQTLPGTETSSASQSEVMPQEEAPAIMSPLVIHTVEKGETFPAIARRYGVTVAQIYTWNHLSLGEKYPKAGQQLMIETAGRPITAAAVSAPVTPAPVRVIASPNAPPVEKTTAPAASEEPLIHIVKPGENLFRIGLRYKVSPGQVAKWNNIVNNTVSPGQRLLIWK